MSEHAGRIAVIGAVAAALLVAACATAAPPVVRDGGGRLDAPDAIGVDAGPGDASEVDGGLDAGADATLPPDGGTPRCTAATAAAICGALSCVDGYCCDQPCTGECLGCAVPGSEGLCVPHAAGADPDAECATDATPCGRTGACDGGGACALRGAETSCDDGADCTTADVCDGTGVCRGMAPAACGPGAGNVCCFGTCAAGTGCSTAAGACTDTCTAQRVTIGQTCNGCGPAGAVGLCMGGGVYVCDATSHVLCQQLSCGGIAQFCTNDGGVWAWRSAARCDDGSACTFGDVCGAGGSCAGTAVTCTSTACATRTCNGTSSCTVTPTAGGSCDDSDACTYGDTCDAAGSCSGTVLTCTSTPCSTRACNGTSSCTVTPRAGACDDGNACTYGETCGASGACAGGTTIDCASMSTTCRASSCSGTSTCATMAVNVGGTCDDGNATTTADVCQSDGTCRGGTGCALPAASCTNGAESRSGCTNAQVIGRTAAAVSGGTTRSGSTCSASNAFNGTCGGSVVGGGRDHAYRIYMLAGERIDVEARTLTPCTTVSYNGVFRIFENAGCSDTACTTQVQCRAAFSFHTTSYTAPRDGWVILVMDGQTISGIAESGSYSLIVELTCNAAGCGC